MKKNNCQQNFTYYYNNTIVKAKTPTKYILLHTNTYTHQMKIIKRKIYKNFMNKTTLSKEAIRGFNLNSLCAFCI